MSKQVDPPPALREQPAPTPPYPQSQVWQDLVGRLLVERDRIMDTLVALVNATAQDHHRSVVIKGEPNLQVAWMNAYVLCKLWQESRAPADKCPQSDSAELGTTQVVPLAEQK